MNLNELITITEKLRTVNIPDEEAQRNLDAAIVYLDLTAERVRKAAKQTRAADIAEGSEQIERMIKEISSASGVPADIIGTRRHPPLGDYSAKESHDNKR